MNGNAIRVRGLRKSFGDVHALAGIDLDVRAGTVLGLLGHNGAGKTTLIRVLATVTPPTAGTAEVAGFDVSDQGLEVRRRIGLTGQFAALDEHLSGFANLVLIARLLGAGTGEARRRATELVEMFDLGDAARRRAGTYSGGMRRRIDLAASLVARPSVLFLDEPTTGLDPVGRQVLWDAVRKLVADGTTVLLTTQYLDEADQLADRIAVLDGGRVVAEGTAAELKATTGSRSLHITLAEGSEPGAAARALRDAGFSPVADGGNPRTVVVPVAEAADLVEVVRALVDGHTDIADLVFTEPTLDDVYMSLARPGTRAAADGGKSG
ncbi:ATP-binding cassette domain-containing protein [Streptomyces sedi]|uniref:ATP-binding cassette domain-containing protein n=1 Tax=Streptomyces sedi TaxID=555059 RepID=A0A5C4UQR2_9ACTN|nr:ATP-binding cassette domain-containing protein [Streptomyces sedi]TNM25755.1 ATP-binding cassette domain-containing protein [Streptomyces sedi]